MVMTSQLPLTILPINICSLSSSGSRSIINRSSSISAVAYLFHVTRALLHITCAHIIISGGDIFVVLMSCPAEHSHQAQHAVHCLQTQPAVSACRGLIRSRRTRISSDDMMPCHGLIRSRWTRTSTVEIMPGPPLVIP